MRGDSTRKAATKTIKALKRSDPEKYWSVSTPGQGYKVHAIGDAGYAGFKADHKAVDVGAIVAKPGASGVVKKTMAKADMMHPEHPQTLDAFDGHLPKIYGKHGFQETGRMAFDPAYAPKEWNPAVHGKPDIVFMQRSAAQGSLFPHTYPTTPPPRNASHALNPRQFNVPGQGTLL